MSEDSFTEVTTESWFGRIGGALKGIVFGLAFFIAAFPVLFWNEGRAVKQYKTLNEGAGSVISLPETRVLPENEGKLVHLSGKAVTDEIVADMEFEVSVNAIKLKRKAEMYQWKESKKRRTKKKLGGGKKTVTTYSYHKSWSSSLIDSSNFKKPSGHQNPGSMPYQSEEFVATDVNLGEFKLSRSLIGKINKTSILPVADLANIEGIPNAAFHDNGIFFGGNPSSPQIGDLRITYQIVAPTDVSIVSRQIGQSFEPYRAEAGGTIDMLNLGFIGAENMFQRAQQKNKMWTWIIRLGGFILMVIGIAMILRPLSVSADVIPFLGNVVGAGTGILAFLIAVPFSFITVAVAWLLYRPVIGISLLILATVIAGFIFVLSKRGRTSMVSSPVNTRQTKRQSDKGLDSVDVDEAFPVHSNPTNPDEIAAANIEKIPQTAKAIQKDAEVMLKKGRNYFRTGEYDKAVMQFSQVIKSGGNRKLALYNRGVALFKLNKRDAALKDFKNAARLGHQKAKAILNKIKPPLIMSSVTSEK
jgi:hypothetical protein